MPIVLPCGSGAVEAASAEGSRPEETREAQRLRRDRGRFTRNFVVQGTAAEWALCWMAALRRRLLDLPGAEGPRTAAPVMSSIVA